MIPVITVQYVLRLELLAGGQKGWLGDSVPVASQAGRRRPAWLWWGSGGHGKGSTRGEFPGVIFLINT